MFIAHNPTHNALNQAHPSQSHQAGTAFEGQAFPFIPARDESFGRCERGQRACDQADHVVSVRYVTLAPRNLHFCNAFSSANSYRLQKLSRDLLLSAVCHQRAAEYLDSHKRRLSLKLSHLLLRFFQAARLAAAQSRCISHCVPPTRYIPTPQTQNHSLASCFTGPQLAARRT
jgi:hypothetical protein